MAPNAGCGKRPSTRSNDATYLSGHLRKRRFVCTTAFATNDCWVILNIKGYIAYVNRVYKFSQESTPDTLSVCFAPTDGTVTGPGIRYVTFSESTLAGYDGNEHGNEIF
jgi:hypothetical protein